MYTRIEIDFDVYKEITVRRDSPDVSENDVLRKLLGLAEETRETTTVGELSEPRFEGWEWKGITLPSGTELLSEYLGRRFSALIENGSITLDGRRYKTPSKAASAITGTQVNGWKFWKFRNPSTANWEQLDTLRGDTSTKGDR